MSMIRLRPRATRAARAASASAAPVTSRSPRRTTTTKPSRTLASSSAPGMTAALYCTSTGAGSGPDGSFLDPCSYPTPHTQTGQGMTPCAPTGARFCTRDGTIPHPCRPGPAGLPKEAPSHRARQTPRTGRTSPCSKHHGPGRASGREVVDRPVMPGLVAAPGMPAEHVGGHPVNQVSPRTKASPRVMHPGRGDVKHGKEAEAAMQQRPGERGCAAGPRL
jgi:hypothetical protein